MSMNLKELIRRKKEEEKQKYGDEKWVKRGLIEMDKLKEQIVEKSSSEVIIKRDLTEEEIQQIQQENKENKQIENTIHANISRPSTAKENKKISQHKNRDG